ncbi:UNVERIFIED_CONTAM: Mitogen-activated protein kinase kinase kinase 20 [Sesamum indicum]
MLPAALLLISLGIPVVGGWNLKSGDTQKFCSKGFTIFTSWGTNGRVKIADFGLTKRHGGRKGAATGCELRGTPLYMSSEMVAGGEQGPPADIWALGCVVVEMLSGNPAWRCSYIAGLMMRIGVGEEVPEIPRSLPEEVRDFLGKCFVKDPSKRWTAEML